MSTRDLPNMEGRSAPEIIAWALTTYGSRVAISASFQAESMVIIDMAVRIDPDVRVFTLDTGRLPNETYALMDEVRAKYGIRIETHAPEPALIRTMVAEHGANLFYRDAALRRLCCHVRKVEPLERALAGLDAWISGLRRDQSLGREATAKVAIDPMHGGIVKIDPLADWSRDQVWGYITENGVPTNALYDQGFTSIGCAPCTRAPEPGEDERAGRWWWEADEAKECGIHQDGRDERFTKELAWLKQAST